MKLFCKISQVQKIRIEGKVLKQEYRNLSYPSKIETFHFTKNYLSKKMKRQTKSNVVS